MELAVISEARGNSELLAMRGVSYFMTALLPLSFVALVMVNHAVIRMAALTYFEDDGFEVLAAANPGEARLALTQRADIAVLFSDIDVPGNLSSYLLQHNARRTHPRLVVMVVSAGPPPVADDMPDRGRFMSKPYDATNMLLSVRQMMALA